MTKQEIEAARDALINALQPTFPNVPQHLGLDLDGVIDENAPFFSMLSHLWPGKVYVITYRDNHDKAVADLYRFHIHYDDVILVNSFAEKSEVIARLNIKVYIDDQDEVLLHIPKNVTVLKMRNGGNYDFEDRKWLYSKITGRPV
jgi:hypothetical protein